MFRLRTWPEWARTLVLMLAAAALYLITARIGLALAMPPEKKATAVWPPSGIALAALLLAGYRIWPGIWIGAFLANLWDGFSPASTASFGTHLIVSMSIATGSTLQAVLGTALVRKWIARVRPLESARSALRFVGIVPLMCLVGATVGVTALVLCRFTPWSQAGFSWWTWWLGDTVGILIVTPLLLGWSNSQRGAWSARRFAEAGLLAGLILGVGLFAFGGWSSWGIVAVTLTYSTLPLLVCATFRFDQPGAALGLVFISGIAIWGTIHGHGPFIQPTLHESLLLLQTFVGVLAVTVLPLAGALAERRRSDQAKRVLIEHLEDALTEIKTIRGLIPICSWCKSIRNDEGSWEQLEAYLRVHTEAEFSHGICPKCADQRSSPASATSR